MERALDGIQLVKESMDVARATKAEDAITSLQKLYIIKGGYTHEEIDKAGFSLFRAFNEEVRKQIAPYSSEQHLTVSIQGSVTMDQIPDQRYRFPVTQPQGLELVFASELPARGYVRRKYRLEVPKDANEQAGPLIRSPATGEAFEARVEEVVPVVSTAVQMRLSMFVERLLGSALAELAEQARLELEKQGY